MIRNYRIVLLLTLVSIQVSFAQTSIQFEDGNLKTAFERSKTEHKPVLLLCYASWCPHCAAMKETVFNKHEVAKFYNQHFICIQQDMEKGLGPEMHKTFNISSYPTFIFMDSSYTVIYRTTGEFKVQSFIQEGKNALTPQMQLPYLKKKFEMDVRNSYNCYSYLRALKKGGIDYTDLVKSYFATQTDKQLLSAINWQIFTNGIDDINTREYRFVLSHLKEYETIASPERVQRKLSYTAKSILTPLVEANDTVNYRINRKQLSEIQNFKIDSLIFTYDITINKYNENWDAYRKITLLSTEKYVWNDYNQLNEIADVYQKNISDSKALIQSIKWIKRSLSIQPEYGTYLICARLYKKLSDIPNAIAMVKQAEDVALKYDWNHTEADTLLKELQQK